MRRPIAALLLAAASLPFIAATPALAQAEARAKTPGEALRQLLADSDEASLKRNPINALFRGDMRYADQLGDYITDAYFAAEKAAGEEDLKRLAAIDRTALNPTDKIIYDVFKSQTETGLKSFQPWMMALTVTRPLDHQGFITFYPSFASGQGAAPFNTLADYENNLKRHREYAVVLDRSIGRFREGLAAGVTQPRVIVERMIEVLTPIAEAKPEDSPFYGPVKQFPDAVPQAERARLAAEYRAMVADVLLPAHKRLRDFLRDEYLPKARTGVGLMHMKGGAALYDYQIENNTTLPLTADYVHNLGLKEVARIRKEMDTIRRKVGFKGTLAQFFEHIRTDPKFKPASKEALREGYYAIGRKVDARIGQLFSVVPKSKLEIRPVPEVQERTAAGAFYQPGTPDGARPGVFYFNTYDLPSRTTPGMETLYLHEGVPGHHFQVSLAQENEALPAFMRFGGNTAYVEGWALYAETLWPQLGLETDPYSRYGGLDDEMLRAMRLVVDSGLHAKGWTRDQAIAYMLANSGMGRTDATSEVERYIGNPGQALAYKIGQLTILRLKAKAQKALGKGFDIREFHDQVLATGGLPMTVLEKKIDDWIAAKRRGA